MNWGSEDFLAAFVLLSALAVGIVFALRLPQRRFYRIAAALAVIVIIALIWAELAVGILH